MHVSDAPPSPPPLCLIVDDNPDNLFISRKIVEDFGYHVIEAESARDAWPHVTSGTFDVLLLDWHMPSVDGITFLKSIRRLEEKRNAERRAVLEEEEHMTILIFSALEGKERSEEAIAAGADGYISKPANRQQVRRVFEEKNLL